MERYFEESFGALHRLAESPPEGLDSLVEDIFDCWEEGGTIISFGNGGSAADSLHFTTELVARLREEPIQKPARSLSSNAASLTAIPNDWNFEELFVRQIEAVVSPADVLLGISTSGNSSNVIKGLAKGKSLGATCYGLTGSGGGEMAERLDQCICVPASETAHVQEAHIACLHYVCHRIDQRLND
ncbi:MAG: SIS domain-containing protein [bacterium]